MAAKVGEHLKHEPMRLRFTTTHTTNGKAKSVVKRESNQTIAAIIPPSYIASYKAVMLYEKLDMTIFDLKDRATRGELGAAEMIGNIPNPVGLEEILPEESVFGGGGTSSQT